MPRRISPSLSKYRLRISRSLIHRWGVFALEPIPRGKKVIEYTGNRLAPAQAERRFDRNERLGRHRRNLYFASYNRRWIIDGYESESGAQFVNHCCDPNLAPLRLKGHLWFVSRRRIKSGEELTLDYRYGKNELKTPCKCGSPKCRGTVNLK